MAVGMRNKAKNISKVKTEKSLQKEKVLAVPVSVSLPQNLNEQITQESNEVMIKLMEKGKSVRSLKSRFIQELIKASLNDEKLVSKIKSDLRLELMSK